VNEADINDAPKIKLAGQEWPVPLLAARQNRIIDPLILSLIPLFTKWQENKAAAMALIGQKEYDALIDIAFNALRRAKPDMTRDQFLDMPVTLAELIAAFPTIAYQTGVFTRGQSSGEAAGA
jgi:hypothetical protein